MEATPTENNLELKCEGFSTLSEALDYAAQGETGYNFYNGKGELDVVLPYAKLKEDARHIARRLLGLEIERGARVAIVADTHPDFLRFFFACQYAGFVPVPLPASIHLGGHNAYIEQLHLLLINCDAAVAVAPPTFVDFLTEAAESLNLKFVGCSDDFMVLPTASQELIPSGVKELAYLQYTSGSTRFPRGVMITQETVMNNLSRISKHGVQARPGDRAMSWLPFFHDMGLVGLVLAPMNSQTSVDYLRTRDFAMRPRLWLKLITQNRSTVSFSPPFGYELCVKRLRISDISKFDLSSWRLAGIGAETIRPEPLQQFAVNLAPAGFNKNSLVACYGMAECSLAVSFAPLEQGIKVDYVDAEQMAESQAAIPIESDEGSSAGKSREFVICGEPLPGYEVEVRDDHGCSLPDRQCGTLYVRGASVMSGYFGEKELTDEVLSSEGWLNTGDLAYRVQNDIIITGREKDLIILNGRNIWPQDMEFLAEQQPDLRTGDASAFSVTSPTGEDIAVLVIECRATEEAKRADLVSRLHSAIRTELGIDCFIELVARNTLPRTTSGKLSRSGARKGFLRRIEDGKTVDPFAGIHEAALMKKAV